MRTLVQGKTAEQLHAEGHWNGEVVEGAHERLFDLVDHYRTSRGIPMLEAVRVVHDDLQAGRLTAAQSACVDIYRRWRAELLGTVGLTKEVSFEEFAFWMRTGQFAGAGLPPKAQPVLKLNSPERQAAFAALMARMDVLVQDQGLPVARAAGRLVNEAVLSTPEAPCEVRTLLQSAMGRGGRRPGPVAAAVGLPSIDTMVKWYLRHRTGAVREGASKPSAPKKWVSRETRWMTEALRIRADKPELTDLGVYALLIEQWRDWWGVPVRRDTFLDKLKKAAWSK